MVLMVRNIFIVPQKSAPVMIKAQVVLLKLGGAVRYDRGAQMAINLAAFDHGQNACTTSEVVGEARRTWFRKRRL